MPATVAGALARRMREELGDLSLLVTGEGARPARAPAEGVAARLAAPADHPPFARALVERWRPDACVWASGRLRPALMDAALRRMPLAVAGARAQTPPGRMLGVPGALMSRARRVMALDGRDAMAWRRMGARPSAVEIAGPLQAGAAPPPHDEEARRMLAVRLAGRPVWHAAAVPDALMSVVLAAHQAIVRRAHRALLILEPAPGARAPDLERAGLSGLACGPEGPRGCAVEDAHEVLVSADPGLRGLWCRVAPLTVMGDTFAPGASGAPGAEPEAAGAALAGAGTGPDAPAALGSALVHGPHTGAHADAYARLTAEGATVEVPDAGALAAAVEALLAPDRAARQAHAAWSVVTRGAEATDRLAALVAEMIDG